MLLNLMRPRDQLPLKAVYKASVVGLRYLIKDKDGRSASFKRFQAKFKNDEDALSFVQAIGKVCPVKSAENVSSNVKAVVKEQNEKDGDSRMGIPAMVDSSSTIQQSTPPRSSFIPPSSSLPSRFQPERFLSKSASLLPASFTNLHSSLRESMTAQNSTLVQSDVNLLDMDDMAFNRMLEKILMDDNLEGIVKRVEESLRR
jgi:hypothetical protein